MAAAGRLEPRPARAGVWWRTLRHLRARQVAHRVRYRARRWSWERRSAAIDAAYRRRAEALPLLRWDHPGLARVAAHRLEERQETVALGIARDALLGRFTFLGRSEELGCDVEWFRADLDGGTRLWKTLLHEFSYATDLARASRRSGDPRLRERLFALARSWRTQAPIGCRGFALDAWNARAVATRLVHWAVAGSVLGLRRGEPDADWLGREIGLHGLFLRDNLEFDLRGNHLLRDCVGLVFAHELVGGVPNALDQLEQQVSEQFLPDGCHEERAPLYHATCTRDLLEVRLLLGDGSPSWLDEALARATGFLASITLGDGEIPLLGDGWLGEVDAPRLLAAAREILAPVPPRSPERHSGLVALRAGRWRAIVRAGRHAPDEQMGHAHSDLLSFDASLGPRRVVTDTGTLLYDPGPERQRIRSTAAHNTIGLDGEEQLEAWGSFRAGRRGRARVVARGRSETWDWVSASHDAYAFLPGRPIHHRLLAVGEIGILVVDTISRGERHRIESHLHEHPDAEAAGARIEALGGPAAIEDAMLHERFGETRSMRRHRICGSDAPWVGGWWIAEDSGGLRVELLACRGDRVELVLAEPELRLEWRPEDRDPGTSVVLCSASRGSAT